MKRTTSKKESWILVALIITLFIVISGTYLYPFYIRPRDEAMHHHIVTKALERMGGFENYAIDDMNDESEHPDGPCGAAAYPDEWHFLNDQGWDFIHDLNGIFLNWSSSATLISAKITSAVEDAGNGEYESAREHMGHIFHTVADHYAHTNFVENNNNIENIDITGKLPIYPNGVEWTNIGNSSKDCPDHPLHSKAVEFAKRDTIRVWYKFEARLFRDLASESEVVGALSGIGVIPGIHIQYPTGTCLLKRITDGNLPIEWTTHAIRKDSAVKLELVKDGVPLGLIGESVCECDWHPNSFLWQMGTYYDSNNQLCWLTEYDHQARFRIRISLITDSAQKWMTESESFTIPFVRMDIPSGSERWQIGSTKVIDWTAWGTTSIYALVTLWKDGHRVGYIANTAFDDTQLSWKVGKYYKNEDGAMITAAPGSGYHIAIEPEDKVCAYDPSDTSNGTFTITYFDILSPLGGESWAKGSVKTISWRSPENATALVKLELLNGAGQIMGLIAENLPANGSHSWIAGTYSGGTVSSGAGYKIRFSTMTGEFSDESNVFSLTPSGSITVTSPEAGKRWYREYQESITWTQSGSISGNVKISLYNGGNLFQTIAADTPNTGSYTWTVPSTLSQGNTYQVRVESISDSGTYGVSAYFNICSSNITVTSPAVGADWGFGTSHSITWSKNGPMGENVSILLKQNGNLVSTITASTPNNGIMEWVVPSSLPTGPGTYRIEVKTTTSPIVSDESDDFSISQRFITVTSPGTGENWQTGSTHIVSWTKSGAMSGTVKIELLKNSAWLQDIIISTPNNGSYSWTLPFTLAEGADYQIQVKSTDGVQSSSSPFVISTAGIDVTSPAAGVSWSTNSQHAITWTKKGTMAAYVDIYLFKAGSKVRDIVMNASNSGGFNWNIPGDLASGIDYQVKVSTVDGLVSDFSPNFTITVPSGTITVTQPTAGAVWKTGSNYIISWSKTGTLSTLVRIQLWRNGSKVNDISTQTANDGSFNWIVSLGLPPANNYFIRVQTSDDTVFDDSDLFTISDAVITVTSPGVYELWRIGSVNTIAWTKRGTMNADVKIELWKSTGKVQDIISSTPNDGSHTWSIPTSMPIGADYFIKVKTLDNLVEDDSPFFFITNNSIIVNAPNGGETLMLGQTKPITWTASGTTNNFEITLWKGETQVMVIASNVAAASRSYSWIVGYGSMENLVGTGYVIQVREKNSARVDRSNSVFSITNPF